MAQMIKRICLQFRRPRFDPSVRKIPLEKGMAIHFSILAWRIPWTEELGGLQSWDHSEWDTTELLTLSLHFQVL